MKMKTKPTERENKRYILVETESKEKVEKAVLDFIGTLGLSESSLFFVDIFNNKLKNGQMVISVNRKKLENIRAAFELSKDKIKIIKVSGTLDGLFS